MPLDLGLSQEAGGPQRGGRPVIQALYVSQVTCRLSEDEDARDLSFYGLVLFCDQISPFVELKAEDLRNPAVSLRGPGRGREDYHVEFAALAVPAYLKSLDVDVIDSLYLDPLRKGLLQ